MRRIAGAIVVCLVMLMSAICQSVSAADDGKRSPDGSTTEVRIFAAYFPYGKGIAEGFAYHPGEQDVGHTGDANSEKLAAIYYGNKFVHVSEGLNPGINPNALQTQTFVSGSFVIPMDDKQTDVAIAFGFLHALLRNGTKIYRIVEPPDVKLFTQNKSAGDYFKGGPIMILPANKATFLQVHQSFASVSFDTLAKEFTSNRVFIVGKPTRILLIKGTSNWGETELLLGKMQIPYALKYTSDINSNPDLLKNYDLDIDDCGGWDTEYGGTIPAAVMAKMREFVANGGEMIYTDRAQGELERAFPGYIPVSTYGPTATWDVTMVNVPEFPGQYYGNPTVKMWQLGSGADMVLPLSKDVRVMAYQSPTSGGTPTISLTAPSGTTINAGSQTSITWSASGGTSPLSVDLEYSVSGSSGPWVTIIQRASNTGSYQWTVPYVPTTDGYVRAMVWDNYWKKATSTSSSQFTISAPQLQLDAGGSAGDYTVESAKNTSISVRVMDAFGVVENANVTLGSSSGGSFNPVSGPTNSNGMFMSTYTAPSTGTQLTDTITATATKPNYVDGSDTFKIDVDPSGQQFLHVDAKLNPIFLHSGDVGFLTVKVTDGTSPVPGASLTLTTTDGYTTPATDTSNATGEASFAYTPPTTPLPITVSVGVTASKASYLDGIGQVTALLNPLLDLKLNASMQKQVIYKGEKSKIYVHAESNTYDMAGADITFKLTGKGSLSANSTVTNSTGDTEVEYSAPASISKKESPVVFITARKPGYTTAQGSVYFTLMPDPQLDVMVVPEKKSLNSTESSKLQVFVSYLSAPIPDASVEAFTIDGKITPSSGKTNATGVFSATYTAPIVGSQITAVIDANASKSGYLNGTNSASITIFPIPPLVVSVASNLSQVESGATASLTVTVTNGTGPVENASVQANASKGVVTPSSGQSDKTGKMTAIFTAPTVTSQTVVTITANASKGGYSPGTGQLTITVTPKGGGTKTIFASVSAVPASLKGGETSEITVTATSDSKPLAGGTVSLSATDGSIDTNSGTTDASGKFNTTFTAPDIASAKDVTITVDVSKSGYTSGKGTVKVHVEPWTGQKKDMTVSISAAKTTLGPLAETTITVNVSEGLVPVQGAKVALVINAGTILPVTGSTDAKGSFKSTLTAPNATADTTVSIKASATKAGYNPADSTITLYVSLKGPGNGGNDNGSGIPMGTIALAGLGIGAAVFLLIILYFMKMRKKCNKCGKVIPKGMRNCPNCQPWQQQGFQF